MATTPLFLSRVVVYALTLAWAIISFSIGLNTIVKQNKLKTFLRSHDIEANTQNLVRPVVASEVFAWITAIVALVAFTGLFIRRYSATRALKIQGYVFTFLTAAIFATEIPVSQVVRKHGIRLPANTSVAAVEALGVNAEYKHIHFALWFAIIPWIEFLFTLLSAVVSFDAVRHVEPEPYSKREEAGVDAHA